MRSGGKLALISIILFCPVRYLGGGGHDIEERREGRLWGGGGWKGMGWRLEGSQVATLSCWDFLNSTHTRHQDQNHKKSSLF